MRTAVDKVRRGKGRTVNPRFAAMCAYYQFDPDVCNVASGWEERWVEKDVQDSRRRIWVEARDRHFGSFEELNAWLAERCRALWAELKHSEYPALTIAEMLEHEQAYLMPMPAPFDGYIEKPARVSSTCPVSVDRNRYSVPCALAGKRVSTRLYPDRMVVVAEDQLVARHARLRNEGHTAYDWQHYIPLLKRKPGALRNGRTVRRSAHAAAAAAASSPARAWWRPGDGAGTGARTRGWAEVVLIAVDLALDADPPSERVRVEHVQNVLTRLHEPALPPPVAASLRVATPPLADPARYDRCRSRKPAGRCRSTSSASSTSTPASSSPPTSTSANGPGCSAM